MQVLDFATRLIEGGLCMRRKWLTGTLLLLFVMVTLSAGASAQKRGGQPGDQPVVIDPALPVHPLLQIGAQRDPNRRVRMIVQKARPGVQSAGIARTAEAPVLEEFSVARTVMLEVPQRVALKLAQVPGVQYISYDGPVRSTSLGPTSLTTLSSLKTTYPKTVRATEMWSGSPQTTGSGISVAVIDTGLNTAHPAMGPASCVLVNPKATSCEDLHGHGTHVAGTINGADPMERYMGIAPQAHVIGVKIADDEGVVTESDLLRGLQWAFDNRTTHNIRVVNLSVSASTPSSYNTSPLSAAVEQLWLNGVVVVASAGNQGSEADATWFAPGNDPFIISVGALDDNSTDTWTDDSLTSFSSRGLTMEAHYKPEIVAPGRRIVAPLASPLSTIGQSFPERVVDSDFIRLTGTSMAAPVVSGAVALLLERHPDLTPDQVKWVLMNSARSYPGQPDSAGLLDIQAAVDLAASGSVGSANQGIPPHSGIDTSTGTVDQVYWDQIYLDQIYLDQIYLDQIYLDGTPMD